MIWHFLNRIPYNSKLQSVLCSDFNKKLICYKYLPHLVVCCPVLKDCRPFTFLQAQIMTIFL